MGSSETREDSEVMEDSDIMETMEASIPTNPIKLKKRRNGRRNQICQRLPAVIVQTSNVFISTVVVVE
jgi:hypothetical protein